MNEPQHPHFVLSDGMYCHVMPEGLIISKKQLPKETPAQRTNPEWLWVILLFIGVGIFGFFFVMSIIAHYYVVSFMVGVGVAFLGWNAVKLIGYTSTLFVAREDVLGVTYHSKSFGYDSFIVRYAGPSGKVLKRRLIIYDSQECLTQALTVMTEQGWLVAKTKP